VKSIPKASSKGKDLTRFAVFFQVTPFSHTGIKEVIFWNLMKLNLEYFAWLQN